MPKRKAQKAASTDTSFLAQLQLLRDFVGSSFSETDLSGCLRHCGFNIQQAAEQLITGEYNKGNNSKTSFNTPSATKSGANKTPSNINSNNHKRPRVTPATTKKTASSNAKECIPQKNKPSPTVASIPSNTNTSATHTKPPDGLWLCERWIVGSSTTKNGSFQYQERLELSHSSTGPPMVRFRGSKIEGTLRVNIGALLTPLLREQETTLISMKAHALMEEGGVPIGGDVPLCLRVYIVDPVGFFAIFDESHNASRSTESAASQFFGSAKKHKGRPRKQPARLPLAEAAFALLQWAEYGDDPTFEPPPSQDSKEEQAVEEDSNSESEELSVLNEDDFEAGSNEEQEAEEWAKDVVDETEEAAKESELPEADNPNGFTDDVVLRPYQKQALYWMLQRESGDNDWKDLEKELTLLAELSQNASKKPVIDPPKQGVVCEVGPVRVSESMAQKSCTIDGVENPVNHPLWQRRFLASADKTRAISFYVNELLGVASSKPPNPPRHCAGGILGDSMGLGKSIMILALILQDKELGEVKDHDGIMLDDTADADKKLPARKESSTTLVVAPLSLILQWEEELVTKTNLKHLVYYGESAKGGIHSKSFKGVDVVVTTYGTIQGELLASKNKLGSKGSGLLSYEWRRVVLDEAHCIKNPTTAVSRACCILKADKRWCVTGTPIQNSLQDVYALIKFLQHEPWCENGFWKAAITNASTEGNGDDDKKLSNTDGTNESKNGGTPTGANVALNRVKRLLAPLILRRTKDTLNKDGQPILVLPPTETITVNVELSTAEREFYNSLLERSQSVFEGFIKSGTASKSWMAIFSLLNRLRQTCDHVALTVKSHLDDNEWNPASLEMSSPSKLKDKSPTRTPKKNSHDKDSLGQEFLDGLLEKFRTKQDTVETTYASQVAHALAKTIKNSATTMEDECPICLDCPLIEETAITPCAHVFCRGCLVGILKNNASSQEETVQCPNGICPSCNEPINAKDIITLSKSPDDEMVTTSYLLTSPAKPKVKDEPETHHVAARQTLEKALRGAGSSKLSAVVTELHKVWEKDPRSKVLIYSQYLGFLDLLQVALDRRNIPTGRLDGKLSLKERVSVLETFRQETNDDSRATGSVLLMSMKAGGVGINMTAASSVFICDPWWNEAVQDQCIARVHRIGQTASVVRVRKFVVTDSVEEEIVKLQRRKRDISSAILSDTNKDGTLSNNTTPTLEDFKILFGAATNKA